MDSFWVSTEAGKVSGRRGREFVAEEEPLRRFFCRSIGRSFIRRGGASKKRAAAEPSGSTEEDLSERLAAFIIIFPQVSEGISRARRSV